MKNWFLHSLVSLLNYNVPMQIAEMLRQNGVDRTLEVFFYGLYMDAQRLISKGVVPRSPRRAFINGHTVVLKSKAILVRASDCQAHGMLFRLTHRELDSLYVALSEYRAEPYLAECEDGRAVAAISMVHIDPPLTSLREAEYADEWQALIRRLGIPGGDLACTT